MSNFSDRLAAALRLTLSDPTAGFTTLESLRQEARDSGARATASAASRALVFAAAIARDSAAELRFAIEWEQENPSEESARTLRAIRSRESLPGTKDAEVSPLLERLALLVEKIVMARLEPELAIRELQKIRQEALSSDAGERVAMRCRDEMILVTLDVGHHDRALELGRDLVLEAPSARAFNLLGRAAIAAGEHREARRAFAVALVLADQEGDADERTEAQAAIARMS